MTDRRVRDIYHKGVIFCKPDTPLQEVVQVLSDTDIHAIIVAEEEEGKPQGIISHTDIIRRYGEDLTEIRAAEMMTPDVKTVSLDATVAEAAQLMLQNHIHRLLVVDETEKGIGILSTTDIVRDMRSSRWMWYIG